MSANNGNGRPLAKSRGRAGRGQQQQSSAAGQPQQSAWGRRPGPPNVPQQAPPARPPPSQDHPIGLGRAGSTAGRGESRTAAVPKMEPAMGARTVPQAEAGMQSLTLSAPSTSREVVSAPVSRGAMRGKRQLPPDILKTRPKDLKTKSGSYGTRIMLQANYFKLVSKPDWTLFQYRVDFTPEEDRTFMRKALLRMHTESLPAYIFDGTVLYTATKLNENTEFHSQRPDDNENFLISIRLVGALEKTDNSYLQFFNITMRRCLEAMQLQLVGRNYFDPAAKVVVDEYRLELWPGYVTSIRQHELGILMCAEITHKVMRQQSVYDILNECYNRNRQDYRKLFMQEVIGCIVLTRYNNHTYRVDDVDFDVTPNSSFPTRDGQSMTYVDYYRNKYQLNIRNLTQPLLVTRSSPRERRAGQAELVYLVPEICSPTGMTDSMRSDFRLMAELAKHTRVSPRLRIEKLMNFHSRLNRIQSVRDELSRWDLQLDNNLVQVPARELPAEVITFGGGSPQASVTLDSRVEFSQEFRKQQMFQSARLDDWVMMCPNRMRRDAQTLISNLVRTASGMRFQISQPRIHEIQDDSARTYAAELERVLSKDKPQLIFCIVSNNRLDRYSAIKKKCCIDRPIPTQVFQVKNINAKGNMSIATKVAIQMNCKIGGAPWTGQFQFSGIMVVGFDVCHDPTRRGRDFGAMVASLDKHFSRYFSAVSEHASGEELSNDLSSNVSRALKQYLQVNGSLPGRIMVYRDGVGEGQLDFVYQHEVETLKTKLAEIYGPNEVKLAYIIVNKRINTRFFKNGENPGPGTIVDDVVTCPLKYDFFLVSQSVKQGTVSPTAYNIIVDTVGLDADKIQRITYKLTHMYFNWSGTVRVPAPCQYAHKLAFLVSQAIQRPPSTQLSNLLYFL